MSTGLIIAIVVIVLILIALLVMMPRMRAKAEERKAQRELESRRERVATENREAASTRATHAERAEQEAVVAEQKAKAERAEAERLESEAQLHERGLADDRLVEDHERDRFQNVAGPGRDHDAADDRAGTRDARTDTATGADERPAAREAGANSEYEQGRVDEAAEREQRREHRGPGDRSCRRRRALSERATPAVARFS